MLIRSCTSINSSAVLSVISPGILLLFYKTASTYVPMTLVSIEDGKKLKTISYPMDHNRLIDFGAIFNEKLLIKLRNENLHITDVCCTCFFFHTSVFSVCGMNSIIFELT